MQRSRKARRPVPRNSMHHDASSLPTPSSCAPVALHKRGAMVCHGRWSAAPSKGPPWTPTPSDGTYTSVCGRAAIRAGLSSHVQACAASASWHAAEPALRSATRALVSFSFARTRARKQASPIEFPRPAGCVPSAVDGEPLRPRAGGGGRPVEQALACSAERPPTAIGSARRRSARAAAPRPSNALGTRGGARTGA
eukprot:359622-Chlamydomonas_euryale.AAC.17